MTIIIRMEFPEWMLHFATYVEETKLQAEEVLRSAFPEASIRVKTWEEMLGSLVDTRPPLDGPLDNDEIDDGE